MKTQFQFIIGVDQTGATVQKGTQAKPLPVVVAFKGQKKWEFRSELKEAPLFLKSFKSENLEELLRSLELPFRPERTACLVDCVLGLPGECVPKKTRGSSYLWKKFGEASDFKFKTKSFGRDVAEQFFFEILGSRSNHYPKRFCEEASGSNSVFLTRPFQKNIQTGTFRIWKEMGEGQKPWARIWPFDSLEPKETSAGPWVFEGYPSLIWREVLKASHRMPQQLRTLVSKTAPDIQLDSWKTVETSPDHADAFVLALGAVVLEKSERLWEPSPSFRNEPKAPREGWLLGLKHPRDI